MRTAKGHRVELLGADCVVTPVVFPASCASNKKGKSRLCSECRLGRGKRRLLPGVWDNTWGQACPVAVCAANCDAAAFSSQPCPQIPGMCSFPLPFPWFWPGSCRDFVCMSPWVRREKPFAVAGRVGAFGSPCLLSASRQRSLCGGRTALGEVLPLFIARISQSPSLIPK